MKRGLNFNFTPIHPSTCQSPGRSPGIALALAALMIVFIFGTGCGKKARPRPETQNPQPLTPNSPQSTHPQERPKDLEDSQDTASSKDSKYSKDSKSSNDPKIPKAPKVPQAPRTPKGPVKTQNPHPPKRNIPQQTNLSCRDSLLALAQRKSELNSSPLPQEILSLSERLGLINLGSTCFANSVHKMLWSHPRIMDWLGSTPDAPTSHSQIRTSLWHLMDSLNQGKQAQPQLREKRKLELNTLFDCFEEYLTLRNSQHSWKDQAPHGTHYFKPLFAPSNPDEFEYFRRNQSDAGEYFQEIAQVLDYSHFFPTIHEGIIRHFTTTGNTTFTLIQNDPKYYLSLSLPTPTPTDADLQQLLRLYLGEEVLEDANAVRNEASGLLERAEQRRVFLQASHQPPKEMVFGINRFEYDVQMQRPIKRNASVQIPLRIEIPYYRSMIAEGPIQEHTFDHPQSVFLRIRSVVVHRGNTESGHYYTYAYDPTQPKPWTKHDDGHVTQVSTQTASSDMTRNAYLVLYAAD